ncbi:MAG: hypothetical protein AAFY84_06320 [Pseudomonadota bacterium]
MTAAIFESYTLRHRSAALFEFAFSPMMKFIASDVETAKAKAKRALGEKTHILSVRDLPSGDVEVSASDKPGPAAPPSRREPTFGEQPRQAMEEPLQRPSSGTQLNGPIEQKFAEDALDRLKGDLSGKSRSNTGGSFDTGDRLAAGMGALLKPHGIDDALLNALVDGARRSRIEEDLFQLQTAFEETFEFAPVWPTASNPIMLVGPTGAGKTSCAAKLAAASMQRYGSAFLMTADVGRAGAIDQIRTYGEKLGADYYVVETPADVTQAMRSASPTGAVILDSPGVSPYDTGDLAALRSFQEACHATPVLVLPASGDVEEYRDWALSFAEFGVRRMIITKFDATRRVGAALTAAHAGRMALAFFSETPFISEGLLEAGPEFLARRLISRVPGRLTN